MALAKITKADFNTAIKTLTTSDATVWWKKLETTDDGTELCFVVGWADGFDPDENLYQQDGYTLCSKIGYKHSDLMVMDYSDFYMPYDKKSGNVWDTDMSVGKGGPSKFDVDWYNDEASQIWSKYGKPNRDGLTALDLMESKKSEAKKHTCSMQKKIESLAAKKKNEDASEGWDVDFFDYYAGRYLGMKALTFALTDAEDLIRELKTSARGVSTGAKTWKELGVWIKEHIVQPFDNISDFLEDMGPVMDNDE